MIAFRNPYLIKSINLAFTHVLFRSVYTYCYFIAISSLFCVTSKCYDCGLRVPYDVKMVKFVRCPYGRSGIVRSP